jgi:hypothetical protein
VRILFWRKRRLPTKHYQKYWYGGKCYIQVATTWTDEGHLVVGFRPYKEYRAEMRLL